MMKMIWKERKEIVSILKRIKTRTCKKIDLVVIIKTCF